MSTEVQVHKIRHVNRSPSQNFSLFNWRDSHPPPNHHLPVALECPSWLHVMRHYSDSQPALPLPRNNNHAAPAKISDNGVTPGC